MKLLNPWVLLAVIPAVATVWLVAGAGHRTVPARQHRIATVVRSVAVVLLVFALAAPLLLRSSGDRSVVLLLDRSASMTASATAAQDRFVADAIAGSDIGHVTAVAVFGRDVRLDRALSTQPDAGPVRTVIDATATDLSGAIRAAAAVLPTEGSRRIVVLTDGVETAGDARAAVSELAESGIAVDVVTVESGRSSDALVTAVDVPATAREDGVVPVRVRLRSTQAGPATLRLRTGDETREIPVELVAGVSDVDIEVPAGEAGVLRIAAEIDAGFDAVPANDTVESLVHVLGPGRIAVVEGRAGDGDDLARALRASGMGAEVLSAVPTAAELLDYDGVVLVNVPAPRDDLAADLAAYVEDLGRGLVVVGGDQAFGLGGYQDTALEALLPVDSDPDELIRRQPVAQVLVIDTSGSMADCHCDGVSEHDPTMQGGVNKTDISRAGAGLAISALAPTDRIGVLAFTSGNRWALPLDVKPSPDVVAAALNTLTPAGDTEISQALREALEALRSAPEEIRHMVLFTDGWGDDPDALGVAQEIAAEGITLSVLGTGEGTGETLRRMASLGGGRFYAGADLDAVPEVFVEETLRVARPLVAEGSFLPALAAASQVTAGLTAAPPLLGYVLTKPKPTASVALEIGPGDPLLATWQRGLGRTTTWSSDATARWSSNWVGWDGFVDFWGRLVGDVLPAGRDTPPAVRMDGGALTVSFTTAAPLDAVAVAHVRGTDGEVAAVTMQRTAEDRFETRIPVAAEGAYWVAVRVEGPDGVVAAGSSGVVASYAEEFAFRDPDPALPAALADATGGRVQPTADQVYDPAPLRGAAEQPLWPLLVAVALGLFLLDVALRRLVLARGDGSAWAAAVTRRRRPPVTAIETPRPDRRAGGGTTPTDRGVVVPAGSSAPASSTEPDLVPGSVEPAEPVRSREMLPEEETLEALLRRKRQRR